MDTNQSPSLSSTDLFIADAQAVLEIAPDYESGLNDLLTFYQESEWDDPAKASKVLEESVKQLGVKFNEAPYFDFETTKESLIPVPIEDIDVADPWEKVNRWEQVNSELISGDDSPEIVALRPKLLESLRRAAVSERRLLNGKDTLDQMEERNKATITDESFVGEMGRKLVGGAVSGLAGLLGAEETEEALTAEDPNASFKRQVAGDVAAAGGFLTGMAGAAATGAAAATVLPIPGVAQAGGAAIGAGAYVLANAVSAIKRQYETAAEASGSTERALAAGGTELVSQGVQAALGGKAIVGLGKRILSRKLGATGTEVAAAAGAGAVTGAAGGGLSTLAAQIGEDNYSAEGILTNTLRGTTAGGLVGAAAGYGGKLTGDYLAKRADRRKDSTNVVEASDLPRSIPAPEDKLANPTEPVEMPYDGRFWVSEEVADKVQTLKSGMDPEGEPVDIYVNETGDLVAKSAWLDPETLEISKSPREVSEVVIAKKSEATAGGTAYIDANAPRATEDGTVEYTSKVTKRSAGAASIEEFGKERAFAKRFRNDPSVAEIHKNLFGEPDSTDEEGNPLGYGLQRYMPNTHAGMMSNIGKFISERGITRAVAEYIAAPKTMLELDGLSPGEVSGLGNVLLESARRGYDSAVKAGDVLAQERFADLIEAIAITHAERGTPLGQGLEGRRLGLTKKAEIEDLVRGYAREEAWKEVAAEEGNVSVDEIKNADQELARVRAKLDEIAKSEDPEVVQLDKDIDETDSMLKELEAEEQTYIDEAQKRADEDIKTAEEEISSLTAKAQEEAAQLETTIKAAEEEIKATEANFDERVSADQEAVQKRLSELEAEVQRLRSIKEPKSRDKKALEKAEVDLNKTRSRPKATRENLIPDKELTKLQRLKDTVQKAKEKKARGGDDKASARIRDLESFIKDTKANKASLTGDKVAPKRLTAKKLKLQKTRETLSKARDERGSRFTAEQKGKYDDLSKKAKKLQELKKRVSKKVQEKVDNALPIEVRERLTVLEAALDLLPPFSSDAIRIETEIARIKHEAAKTRAGKITSFNNLLHTYYAANILFRGSTQAVNFAANVFQVPMKAAAYTVTGLGGGRAVTDGINYIVDFLGAAKRSGLTEASRVFKEGKEATKTLIEASSRKPISDLSLDIKESLSLDQGELLNSLEKQIETVQSKLEDTNTSPIEKAGLQTEKDTLTRKIAELKRLESYGEGGKKLVPYKSPSTKAQYSGHISEPLRKTIDSWIAGFGLGDVVVVTPADLYHKTFQGTDVDLDRALNALRLHTISKGSKAKASATSYAPKKHAILLKDGGDSYDAFKVASHEVGHLVWLEKVVNAPDSDETRYIFNAVLNKFMDTARGLQDRPDTPIKVAQEVLQGPQPDNKSSKQIKDISGSYASYLFETNPGLEEYVANRVTEYVLNPDKKPSGVAERYLKGIADTFRKLWETVSSKFSRSKPLETWLDENFDVIRAQKALNEEALETAQVNYGIANSIGEPRFSLTDLENAGAKETGLTVKEKKVVGYEDPVDQLAKAKGVGPALKFLGYSLRALSAADALFTRSGYEAEAALKVRTEGRRKGLSGEKLKSYVAQELFNSEADWNASMAEAKRRAAILESVGIKSSERDLVSSAWSIMDQKRRADIRAEAAYAAGISWLNTEVQPRGIMGAISYGVTNLFNKDLPIPLSNGKKIEKVGTIIQPFMNTTMKVANLTIDATPLGFAKAALGATDVVDPRTGKVSGYIEPGNVLRTQLGSAIVGTTLMGLLYAGIRAQQDDPDPFFDIIGPVPKNNEGKAVFYGAGKKPWSVKVGDTYYSFVYTPLVGPLGAVAMLNHRLKYDKGYKEEAGLDVIGTLMLGSMKAFSDLAVLRTASNFFEALTSGEDRKGAIADYFASTARGLAIPGVTILEEIDRAFSNPTSTKNGVMSKVLRATPFASLVDYPQLNFFGEEIERNWMERLPIFGSMAGRFVSLERDDPDFLWLSNNGYKVAGLETKITLRSEDRRWEPIKDLRSKNLGAEYDDVLTQAENYELQKRVGPIYRQIVSSYRIKYGNHGYVPEIEKALKDDLSDVKSKVKYQMFIEGAYPSMKSSR